MPRDDSSPRDDALSDYATIRVTHHALHRERAEIMRRRRSQRPECLVVGHAWTEDTSREHGSICMTCQVVRWP